ncbi:transposase, partial [Candidatus Peregrinibacteria bacterium]|nr:transposase [Candidatus Peregrinibacteria bacterium]
MNLHRNSQKRIYIPDAAYFITVKTLNNEPFFRESIFCDLFVENLRVCKRLKEFELYGWILAYDHFHLLIRPGDRFNYSKIMQFLKRHFTRNANVIMG